MGLVIRLFKGGNRMTTIFDVANYFISRSESENPMTPLKLQKLCYYAQAWSLVWDDDKLFDDEFQAWVHGPASYELYKKYQGYSPIKEFVGEFNENIFSNDQLETLQAVWDGYGSYSGKYLEQLTHNEDPWKNARVGYSPGQPSNVIIDKNSMKEYYSNLSNG